MKKFLCYAACYGVLQILGSEVFSTLVLLCVVVYLVSRFFGDVYKEAKK
jgi:Na+-transporting methylmalonyl-CoA/oxaloacetate decarboxylase gamma subunit